MARRLIPKFLAVSENISRGTIVAGGLHGALLGVMIIAAPQLFGDDLKRAEAPITIQIFEGIYEDPHTAAEAAEDSEDVAKAPEVTIEEPAPPEPEKVLEKPKTAPEIAVPDVREAAIDAATRAERPADSGPVPEPTTPGSVALAYEKSTPLTPKQELGERPKPAPKSDKPLEPLPETSRELEAEIRRLQALTAQARVEQRVAKVKEDAPAQADAEKRLQELQQRLQRLTVARADNTVVKSPERKPPVERDPELAEERPRLETARPKQELTRTVEPRARPATRPDELPEPPLPKLSAADILKRSERRETPSEELSEADRERARKSLERFRKAADEGIRSAEMNVARALDKGKGVEKDKKKATEILEKLAKENYQPAQIELAKKHLTGDGVEKDRKRAYILLKTAAEENNVVARRALKALDKEMDAEERQLAEKEAGKWRRFIQKQRAENKLPTVEQRKLDNDLRVAVDKGNVQRIENLLRSGADPNAIDASGRDAIIAAAWRGREFVVEFLIEKGVDLDTVDFEGRTPLIWASINGYSSIVEDLLTEGASPDTKDDSGRTALMRAAWNGHDGVVRSLLENGASPLIQDNDGKTALDRAREEDFKPVVQVLEGYPKAN